MLSSAPLDFVSMYKPGGTMIASINHVTGWVIDQHQDKWGRWSSQTFRGNQGRRLTVVSAYQQVATNKPHSGLMTAASQQLRLLLWDQDEVQSPRIAFKRDLKQYLRNCLAAGDGIILVGDFNEPLGTHKNGIGQLAAELNLIDMMQLEHSADPPATYSRGRTWRTI